MTAAEIGNQVVALCRDGKYVEAVETLYGDGVVSVEAMDFQGEGREMQGKETVRGKNVKWLADNDVHSVEVQGPFVSPERFAICYRFDFTRRASGERVRFEEVGVYTVEGGKIVREEFLYGAMA